MSYVLLSYVLCLEFTYSISTIFKLHRYRYYYFLNECCVDQKLVTAIIISSQLAIESNKLLLTLIPHRHKWPFRLPQNFNANTIVSFDSDMP